MRLTFLISILLGGCSVSAPITGTMSDGQPISGEAYGDLNEGRVSVEAPDGTRCVGNYDPFSQARSLSVPLRCSSNVTGMAQVERDASLVAGSGTFTLSDGRDGSFEFAVE